jgi:iron complex outermembrane receptor protein
MRISGSDWLRASVSAAVLASALAPAAVHAQTQASFNLNIPSQDLGSALRALAKATGEQLIFAERSVQGKRSPALIGVYSVQTAMHRLLDDSALSAYRTSGGAIAIAVSERTNSGVVMPASVIPVLAASADRVPSPPPPAREAEAQIGEVVVTATRRSDTIHNIPLTIQAVTSEQIEVQGLKTAQDVARTVPALRIGPTNSGAANVNNTDVAIRGVRSTTGAPTTGIYIDDVPMQQRGALGSGTIFPQLFDIERVEVLKGPQGTLYGGSSEGGTVRFITASPSFNRYSASVRGEAAAVEGGDANYEAGVSVGGPIVEDKLAFRLSGSYRKDGGWIDHISRFSGKSVGDNTNSQTHGYFHLTIAWKPTDRATVTLSYMYNGDKYRDNDTFWENIPQYKATVGPATLASPAGTTYTYGPFNMFGLYKSGWNTDIGDQFYTSDAQVKPELDPHVAILRLPSLTLDYAFDKMNVKSLTALSLNRQHADIASEYNEVVRGGGTLTGTFNQLPSNSPFIANLPVYRSTWDQRADLRGLTEELRFSSNDAESPLSWVGGVFYNYTALKSDAFIDSDLNDLPAAVIRGISQTTPLIHTFVTSSRFKETQLAAFGEATVRLGEHWRVTGGIRWTRDQFNFVSSQGGPLVTGQLALPAVLTLASQGQVTESPITPKVAVQYVVNKDVNLYANAERGFRPGGVNGAVQAVCLPQVIAAGFVDGAPPTYGSDNLWNYEGGAKINAFGGRAKLDASVFRIDWNNVQTPLTFACGQGFTSSVGSVRSQGGDLQASFRLFQGFTVSGAVAYTNAKYTATAATPVIIIGKGDRVPFTPKWTGSIAAEYTFTVGGHRTYLRGDYQFQSSSVTGLGPTTVSYTPDNYVLPSNSIASARAGMAFGKLDVALFVNNLTKSTDILTRGGITGQPGRNACKDGPACTVFTKYTIGALDTTFKPRTIGISLAYRY